MSAGLALIAVATRRAIVVAHPDDESLWAGGLPIRYPGRWVVICCSMPRVDPIRAVKFLDACAVLGARGILRGAVEPGAEGELRGLEDLDLSDFDLIATHNAAGEYGHAHHRQVHGLVMDRWSGPTITFGYRPGGAGQFRIDLDPRETARKLAALKCYDHVSPSDGKPKWEALLARYALDLSVETHDVARA